MGGSVWPLLSPHSLTIFSHITYIYFSQCAQSVHVTARLEWTTEQRVGTAVKSSGSATMGRRCEERNHLHIFNCWGRFECAYSIYSRSIPFARCAIQCSYNTENCPEQRPQLWRKYYCAPRTEPNRTELNSATSAAVPRRTSRAADSQTQQSVRTKSTPRLWIASEAERSERSRVFCHVPRERFPGARSEQWVHWCVLYCYCTVRVRYCRVGGSAHQHAYCRGEVVWTGHRFLLKFPGLDWTGQRPVWAELRRADSDAGSWANGSANTGPRVSEYSEGMPGGNARDVEVEGELLRCAVPWWLIQWVISASDNECHTRNKK